MNQNIEAAGTDDNDDEVRSRRINRIFLLMFLLLVAGCTVWVVMDWIRETSMKKHWKDLGGLVTRYENGRVIELSFKPRSPQDMSHLLEIRNDVKQLILIGDAVTDDALIELQHLTAIEDLQLLETRIKGPGLAHLQNLQTLIFLEVEMPLDDETDIPSIDFSAHLFQFDIKGTHATDKGIQYLENIENSISTLDLSNSAVTDQGLLSLEGWRQRILDLDLRNTRITDTGLKNIQQLSAGIFLLRKLNVSGTQITDAGIPFLEAHRDLGTLDGLETIDVSNTAITSSGIEALEAMHPKAEIFTRSSNE